MHVALLKTSLLGSPQPLPDRKNKARRAGPVLTDLELVNLQRTSKRMRRYLHHLLKLAEKDSDDLAHQESVAPLPLFCLDHRTSRQIPYAQTERTDDPERNAWRPGASFPMPGNKGKALGGSAIYSAPGLVLGLGLWQGKGLVGSSPFITEGCCVPASSSPSPPAVGLD